MEYNITPSVCINSPFQHNVMSKQCLTMSLLEQLLPLISLCQACGMIPFTVKYDSSTRKFSRFSFSFRHYTSWWFYILIFVLQVSVPFLLLKVSKKLKENIAVNQVPVPFTLTMLADLTMFGAFFQLFISRWLVLRYRLRLRNVVTVIQEVEKLLQKMLNYSVGQNYSVTKRFCIGFTTLIVSVNLQKPSHFDTIG